MTGADAIATTVGVSVSMFGAVCVFLVVAGLPGTWILIGLAVAIDFLDWLWLPPGSPLTFHPLTLLLAVVIGLVGEALELILSAFGAKRFGASRRGMVGSVIGGVFGAVIGTFLLAMLPILGTLIGAAIGTATGAVIGETITGERGLRESAGPAFGAVLGRALGTLAKLPVAIAVWILLSLAAFVA